MSGPRRDWSEWVFDIDIPLSKMIVRFALVVAGFVAFCFGVASLLTYGGIVGAVVVAVLACLLIAWAVRD